MLLSNELHVAIEMDIVDIIAIAVAMSLPPVAAGSPAGTSGEPAAHLEGDVEESEGGVGAAGAGSCTGAGTSGEADCSWSCII